MRAHSRWIVLSALLGTLFLTLGCPPSQPTPTPGTNGTPPPEGPETTRQDSLPEYYRFPINTPAPTLDPAHVTDTVSSSIVNQLFDGLVRIDPDGNLVGELATAWTVEPDGVTYRFTIREGVKFHNGRAMSAEDIAYSLDRILAPETASEKEVFLRPLKGAAERHSGAAPSTAGIVVDSPTQLTLITAEPNALFLWYLAQSTCRVVAKEVVAEHGEEFTNHPVGTGPFMLSTEAPYNPNEGAMLVANPDYWGGRPKINGIKYVIEREEKKRFEGFRSAQYEHTDIPPTEVETIMADEALMKQIVDRPTFDQYHIAFNCEKPPFKDNPKLRQALNYAIDRDYIANTVLKGTRVPVTSFLPLNFPGYDTDPASHFAYDPKKAAELLAEAGYPEGKGLEAVPLSYSSDETHTQIMQAVQKDLATIGVNVELRPQEWASFLQFVDAGEHVMSQHTWLMDYPDPDNIYYVLLHSANKGEAGNHAFWGNPEFDRLVEEAQRVTDPAQRKSLYEQAGEIAFAEAPWLFLLNRKCQILVQPYVHGLQLTSLDRAPVIPGVNMEPVEFK